MRPHSFPVRVYFEDTDAGGMAYHATYLRWAERARTEALRDAARDRRVVTVCRSGVRSRTAAAALRRVGIEADTLAGGLEAWHAAEPAAAGAPA